MNLSKVKYKDILFKLSDDELERIVFSKNKKLRCADIVFVLGGISMIPYRVDKAYHLYKDGYVKKILLSGGVGYFNKNRNITEAFVMKNYLLNLGVLEEDILIEGKSRNTYQNVLYSYNLLKNNFNLNKTSFILVTSDFHIRRFSMLFKKCFNNSSFTNFGVCDDKFSIHTWKNSFYGKKRIKQEALLLCYYVKKRKIDDIKY